MRLDDQATSDKMTGVALTERTIVEHRPGYRDYQRHTRTFIPWWPKKAGH
jgi:steroid 5-alpha reductase family enzyme